MLQQFIWWLAADSDQLDTEIAFTGHHILIYRHKSSSVRRTDHWINNTIALVMSRHTASRSANRIVMIWPVVIQIPPHLYGSINGSTHTRRSTQPCEQLWYLRDVTKYSTRFTGNKTPCYVTHILWHHKRLTLVGHETQTYIRINLAVFGRQIW